MALSAFSVSVPTRSEIVGAWHHRGPDGKEATLVFRNDGTLIATGIPREIFAGVGDPNFSSTVHWDKTDAYVGTWKIEKNGGSGGPDLAIDLSPPSEPKTVRGEYFFFEGDGKQLTLNTFVGLADNNVVFPFSREEALKVVGESRHWWQYDPDDNQDPNEITSPLAGGDAADDRPLTMYVPYLTDKAIKMGLL